MEETLKMMKNIIIGEEKYLEETELIKQYQNKLSPNVLAYFFIKYYNLIIDTGNKYKILTDSDKASFCLQELDKALLNYNYSYKFCTFFIKCYYNRLRTEYKQLNYNNQKLNIISKYSSDIEGEFNNIPDKLDSSFQDLAEDYNLTTIEIEYCRLSDYGYNAREIADLLNKSVSYIYNLKNIIKNKILI